MSISAEYLRHRIVRLRTPDDETAGVGFRVTEEGPFITCAHVLSVGENLIAETVDGTQEAIELIRTDPNNDVGTFKAALPTIPIAVEEPTFVPAAWVALGFPYSDADLVGPLLATGAVGNRTSLVANAGSDQLALPVLALMGGDIRPGMSGAPVVSPDSGALIGMISRDFFVEHDHPTVHGFALPIQLLATSMATADLVAAAHKVTPRHGPRPNRCGALLAVRHATRRAVVRIDREIDVSRTRRVRRERFSQIFEAFFNSDYSLLTLIDASGVGKTTALVDLAERADAPPLLLLRGVDIRCAEDGPAELFVRALQGYRPDSQNLTPPTLSQVVTATREQPLVIAIDGLNEQADNYERIRKLWLPMLADLAEQRACRLVLTCRPEIWPLIVGTYSFANIQFKYDHPESTESDARQGRSELTIGDFTDAERDEYLRRRDLSDLVLPATLRHPLAVAIACQLAESGRLDRQNLDRTIIYDEFLKFTGAEIASRRSQPTAAARLRQCLSNLALHGLHSGTDRFSLADDSLLMEFADDLLKENLLIEIDSGSYRFRYDELYEHLQAQFIDPIAYLGDPEGYQRGKGFEIPGAAVVASCRRLAAGRPTEELFGILRSLLHDRDFTLLLGCATAAKVNASAHQAAADFVGSLPPRDWVELSFANDLIEAVWPLDLKFELLEYLVRSADGKDFRQKDVHFSRLPSVLFLFEMMGLDRTLNYLWKSNAALTETILARWLTRTDVPLGWGKTSFESSLATWTLCALVVMSTEVPMISPRRVVELLRGNKSYISSYGTSLGDLKPKAFAQLLQELAQAGELEWDEALLALMYGSSKVQKGLARLLGEAAAQSAMVRLRRPALPRQVDRFIYFAAGDIQYHDELWLLIRKLIKDTHISVSTLSPFLKSRWGEVISLAKKSRAHIASSNGIGSPHVYMELATNAIAEMDLRVREDLTDLERTRLAELARLIKSFRTECGNLQSLGSRELELLLYQCNVESFRILDLGRWCDDIVHSGDAVAIGCLTYYSGDRHNSAEGPRLDLCEIISIKIVDGIADVDDAELLMSLSLESIRRLRPTERRIGHVKTLVDHLRCRFGQPAMFKLLNQAVRTSTLVGVRPWWGESVRELLSLPPDTAREQMRQLLPSFDGD